MSEKRNQLTVLFIDDNLDILNAFEMYFINMGLSVLIENDPVTGIELFRKNKDVIDILVTDHAMKDVNGIEVANRISEIKDIPIIILTGNPINVPSVSELPSVNKIITKPINLSDLHDIIKNSLKVKLK